jgi:phospholipid/cholesterol/gamma-HCH transport system permease protein
MHKQLSVDFHNNKLLLKITGELNVYHVAALQREVETLSFSDVKEITLDLQKLSYLDTTGALYLNRLYNKLQKRDIKVIFLFADEEQEATIDLVRKNIGEADALLNEKEKATFLESIGKLFYNYYIGFVSFVHFFGRLFISNLRYLTSIKYIRFKEIAFEIYESAIKALGIIALTSFLIGLVVAYQSAYQLKIYGANIFIVDMLGISIFRELAPLITAIVIAGRSGSAYAAQIGAMKITQELDAMRTMGFEPFRFLVLPRIIALMITMPILIFVADMMAIFGGMLIANIDLHITPSLFIDRLNEVVATKHFVVGIIKGPFFAFLIASIGIYRGLMVKDDTQSIGFNTTKSVVESIFAVIVCDAIFSIAFTNLGI